jgi:hypothetical protein
VAESPEGLAMIWAGLALLLAAGLIIILDL